MSTDAPADPVAARLAEARALIGARDELVTRMKVAAVGAQEFNTAQERLAERAPALLGALEAARKLADEWDEAAATSDASAAAAAERGAAAFRTDQMAARAQARRDCAQSLREHIARELLGEAGTDA